MSLFVREIRKPWFCQGLTSQSVGGWGVACVSEGLGMDDGGMNDQREARAG